MHLVGSEKKDKSMRASDESKYVHLQNKFLGCFETKFSISSLPVLTLADTLKCVHTYQRIQIHKANSMLIYW